jgi:hypothetical protein
MMRVACRRRDPFSLRTTGRVHVHSYLHVYTSLAGRGEWHFAEKAEDEERVVWRFDAMLSEILCRGGTLVPESKHCTRLSNLEHVCATSFCMLTVQTAESRHTQLEYLPVLLHQPWWIVGSNILVGNSKAR